MRQLANVGVEALARWRLRLRSAVVGEDGQVLSDDWGTRHLSDRSALGGAMSLENLSAERLVSARLARERESPVPGVRMAYLGIPCGSGPHRHSLCRHWRVPS